ncbi:hypothetical protein B0H66DRAFT_569237 [Apodospora peruviana]|uniref:Uncharacterized protein n=1 Tax=Apodospora peruviana TaxID=516989 RepID=A0AAE0LZT8_9PEZI|nr:hypothetical protein B0H66DRAFT_569237 [Apodospora peruviana]
MVVTTLPALIPDIRKVYNSYFAAFKNERMGQMMLKVIFPNDDTDSDEFRNTHAKGTLSWMHTCDYQYTWKAVDTTTGEIVGMALFDIHFKWRTEEERKNHGVPWLTGEAKERAERVLNPLHDIREELFGGAPHICKSSLCLSFPALVHI